MDELIRRVDVARPLLEKYREVKRQAERARNLRNLGSCLAFRSDMETLRACIQIAVEAPAMGEAGGMIQEAAVRRPVLQDALVMYGQQAQIDMMLEEMAELSKALLKLRRAKKHEITEPESSGYDEVGAGNEQSAEQSAGNRESGGHLRLDYYDRAHEDKSLPFFGGDDTIREILGITPH